MIVWLLIWQLVPAFGSDGTCFPNLTLIDINRADLRDPLHHEASQPNSQKAKHRAPVSFRIEGPLCETERHCCSKDVTVSQGAAEITDIIWLAKHGTIHLNPNLHFLVTPCVVRIHQGSSLHLSITLGTCAPYREAS